jgi:hypothetical protein
VITTVVLQSDQYLTTSRNTRARRGSYRMVVRFMTNYVISTHHHYRCEFEFHSGEVYSIQYYVIKSVTCDRWVVFSGFLHQYKTDGHDIPEILLKVALNTIILTPHPMCTQQLTRTFGLGHDL